MTHSGNTDVNLLIISHSVRAALPLAVRGRRRVAGTSVDPSQEEILTSFGCDAGPRGILKIGKRVPRPVVSPAPTQVQPMLRGRSTREPCPGFPRSSRMVPAQSRHSRDSTTPIHPRPCRPARGTSFHGLRRGFRIPCVSQKPLFEKGFHGVCRDCAASGPAFRGYRTTGRTHAGGCPGDDRCAVPEG